MTKTFGLAKSVRLQNPPGPTGHFLLGSAKELRTQGGHRFALNNLHQYGDICHYRILRWPIYMVNHPNYIKYVLQDNHRNYGKQTLSYRILRLTLGNGLLTSDGPFWLRQRRLVQAVSEITLRPHSGVRVTLQAQSA